jgi:hypothetical protein
MRATGRIVALGLALTALAVSGAERLSDPTRPFDYPARAPAAARTGAPPAPVLQSTFVSAGRKSAIISGVSVHEGDRFRGAVVSEIAAYEVRLRKDGHETVLRLHPRLNKQ